MGKRGYGPGFTLEPGKGVPGCWLTCVVTFARSWFALSSSRRGSLLVIDRPAPAQDVAGFEATNTMFIQIRYVPHCAD
jgi:hypothetical protein